MKTSQAEPSSDAAAQFVGSKHKQAKWCHAIAMTSELPVKVASQKLSGAASCTDLYHRKLAKLYTVPFRGDDPWLAPGQGTWSVC